ncbi:MAG TPA: hypothetical protein VMW95_03450 [Desulfobacterales bacterium]|nr:hypothetical protein [Desulfobacterales bacterium]
MIQREQWQFKDLERALKYFQSIDWALKTENEIDDFKSLLIAFSNVKRNLTTVLDSFLKDQHLKAFLIIHSVFKPDAITHGEFIEYYMASRLRISEEQAQKPFLKKIPDDIKKQFELFDIEPIPFEIYPYRVEYGCRADHIAGTQSYNPINVIDLDWELDKENVFKPEEFISQYEDIIL